MKVSIIIPVYNEEKTISEIIKRVKEVKLPPQLSKEIIVVNDSSVDKSTQILRRLTGIKVINHKVNTGKGAALRTGFKKATGEISWIRIVKSQNLNLKKTNLR